MMERIAQEKIAFDQDGRVILRGFDRGRPFSSFLPGIAGLLGTPLWAFYVNRGQAMSSFGIESKDHPILEFQTANRAYQLTALHGFRTFVRGESWFYEPFQPMEHDRIQRDMFIGMNEFEIEEQAPEHGLQTNVLYFTLPEERFGALVRCVTLTNLSDRKLSFEVLDGLPAITPAGVNNWFLKHMGRTIEAWMEVGELETRIPFFKLLASPGDATEVTAVTAGNFALALSDQELLPAVVDPSVLFGQETSFRYPERFAEGGWRALLSREQVVQGRTPCAFFGTRAVLGAGEALNIDSIYGHAATHEMITHRISSMQSPDYFNIKRRTARRLADELTDPIATSSAHPAFDAYSRQTMLDNILRGGWPLILAEDQAYHVYSRKHGDPERDYNHFFLAAQPYSQGNGNYRDVNQNRRNDLFFEPRTGAANIHTFMSLIRSDGYNPLVVHGTSLSLPAAAQARVQEHLKDPDRMGDLLEGSFTLGELIERALKCGLTRTAEEFLGDVLKDANPHLEAEHGEGFWTDHWTYNLDLIEAYLAIYPDQETWLLFDSPPLAFFDSEYYVQPRNRKCILSDGTPQQSNAVVADPEKAALIQARPKAPNWVRSEHGRGEIFRLPLISKLVMLALLKFTTLDPDGLGVEMEAGKPGWCDALNGLPGMFGSSMAETYELLRLLKFLTEALERAQRPVQVPVEAERLLRGVITQVGRELSAFIFWDAVASERERYRAATRLGFDGATVSIDSDSLLSDMKKMIARLEQATERAARLNDGFPPTYFYYQVTEYEALRESDQLGRPYIRPLSFERHLLPDFLEGPVRRMKLIAERQEALNLHRQVKASELYDRKLGMYRLNASLADLPHSIGRARAFTPGWLENESIWLHMSYKYLLELLRAGLDEEFFSEMQTHLVPFFDPDRYGRSVLENSSFLVSSAHPDPTLHGAGFVARLSGATTEFLSMWVLMMAGERPLRVEDGELQLCLRPSLPGWLFKDDGTLSFQFLGHTRVTFYNPERENLSRRQADEIVLTDREGGVVEISGGQLGEELALKVRNGQVAELDLYYARGSRER